MTLTQLSQLDTEGFLLVADNVRLVMPLALIQKGAGTRVKWQFLCHSGSMILQFLQLVN